MNRWSPPRRDRMLNQPSTRSACLPAVEAELSTASAFGMLPTVVQATDTKDRFAAPFSAIQTCGVQECSVCLRASDI